MIIKLANVYPPCISVSSVSLPHLRDHCKITCKCANPSISECFTPQYRCRHQPTKIFFWPGSDPDTPQYSCDYQSRSLSIWNIIFWSNLMRNTVLYHRHTDLSFQLRFLIDARKTPFLEWGSVGGSYMITDDEHTHTHINPIYTSAARAVNNNMWTQRFQASSATQLCLCSLSEHTASKWTERLCTAERHTPSLTHTHTHTHTHYNLLLPLLCPPPSPASW